MSEQDERERELLTAEAIAFDLVMEIHFGGNRKSKDSDGGSHPTNLDWAKNRAKRLAPMVNTHLLSLLDAERKRVQELEGALRKIVEICRTQPISKSKDWEQQWWENMNGARKLAESLTATR